MSDAQLAGAQLYEKLGELLAPPTSLAGAPAVLLMEPSGKSIDPEDFRDVGGTAAPARNEAFADLVNPIPVPGPTFVDSARLCDKVYQLIVESAATSGDAGDPVSVNAARLIQEARFDIETMVVPRGDIATDHFHPALANPARWWDPAAHWGDVSFTVGRVVRAQPTAPSAGPAPALKVPSLAWRQVPTTGHLGELAPLVLPRGGLSLAKARTLKRQPEIARRMAPLVPATVGQSEPQPGGPSARAGIAPSAPSLRARPALELLGSAPTKLRYGDLVHMARILDMHTPQTETEPTDTGFSVSFEYCVVSIERPWFHRELFDAPGWWLPGFANQAISNGQPTNNPGLLPAITTRFLVVRNLLVHAAWSAGDRVNAMKAGAAAGMSFGPFALTSGAQFDGAELRCSAPQVVAWLASILPACPVGH